MIIDSSMQVIGSDALLERVRQLHDDGYRLVQVGAVRLPDGVEVTYSFDRLGQLVNLRLTLPSAGPRLPSISSVYACVLLYENEIHDLFNVQVDGMAVDFKGNLYKTAVKFPFGTVKAPASKGATGSAARKPASPTPL